MDMSIGRQVEREEEGDGRRMYWQLLVIFEEKS